MIVFWSENDQRGQRYASGRKVTYLREDVIHCHRGFRALESDDLVYVHTRRVKKVRPCAVFDDRTTPWTLEQMGSGWSALFLSKVCPKFPATFISKTSGDVLDVALNVVMEGPRA